jgi:hypothetical protein
VAPEGEAPATVPAPAAPLDDFAPLALGVAEPASLTDRIAADEAGGVTSGPPSVTPRAAARAVGTLVHRAIAAGALTATAAGRAVLADETVRGEPDASRAAVLDAIASLAGRPEVAALISGSHVQHEVPVSVRAPDGTVIRAVVDMIVQRPDGVVTVVELKTGAPREADARQLAAYVEAIRALAPSLIVESRMIRVDL